MAVLRNRADEKYVIVPTEAIDTKVLKLEEIGLLLILLSMPDGCEFTEENVSNMLPLEERKTIRAGVRSLVRNGYLKRDPEHDAWEVVNGSQNSIILRTIKDTSIFNSSNIIQSEARQNATRLVEESGLNAIVKTAVEDWLSYKREKGQSYKQSGLKALLTQIKKASDEYGDAAVADVIYGSMASNYTGITLDKLKKSNPVEKPDRLAWIWDVNLDDE